MGKQWSLNRKESNLKLNELIKALTIGVLGEAATRSCM